MNKVIKKLFTVISVLLICALFSGCKPSPAIEEHLLSEKAEQINNEDKELLPDDTGKEDERFENTVSDDADVERDTADDEGIHDESSSEEASRSVDVEVNTDPERDWKGTSDNNETQAQEGNKNTASSSENKESASQTETAAESTAPETSTESTAPETSTESTAPETNTESTAPETKAESGDDSGKGSESEKENEGGKTVPGGDRTYKQVVDNSGELVDVPDDVRSVAAVGIAAQMVEMLAGSGVLKASNQDFLNSELAGSSFTDLSQVSCLWTGDGSGNISDDDFASLLSIKPDACIEISGSNTFSDAQVAALENAGVSYIVLPQINSISNLTKAAEIMGNVLSGENNNSPADKAASYVSWVTSLLGDVSSRTSETARSTIYIKGWDMDASYTYQESLSGGFFPSSGYGLAYAEPSGAALISELTSKANVKNESNRKATYRSYERVYITPLFTQLAVQVEGNGTFIKGDTLSNDQFISVTAGYGDSYSLGNSRYPAVIAADDDTAEQIRSSPFWKYYEGGSYGCLAVDGVDTPVKYRIIAGDYSVYVNPEGMLDWAEGSLESPLESLWIAYAVQGAYTLDEVIDKTNSFYQDFFGHSLTSDEIGKLFS